MKKVINLSKKQVLELKELIKLVSLIDGIKMRKNVLTGGLKIFVPELKRNPKLSGKSFYLKTPYVTSGIIHK